MDTNEENQDPWRDREFRVQVWAQVAQLLWLPLLVIAVVVLIIKGLF